MKSKIIGLAALVLLIGAGVFAWPRAMPAPVSTQGSDKPAAEMKTGIAVPGTSDSGSLAVPTEKTARPADVRPATDAPQTDGQLPQRPRNVEADDGTHPIVPYKTLAVPNDPSYSQWWVTQSKLAESWDIPAGTEQTVLAVIDTGYALGHEEFADRWYMNDGEKGVAVSEAVSSLNCTGRSLPLSASCNLIDDDGDGIVDEETGTASYQNPSRLNCTAQSRPVDKSCNRIDDDGNGYVDDVSGWDFINYDNVSQAGELNPSGSGTTHGTRVAGIAAATGNNSKGIAGADWNTKILPIQAMDDDSYGDTLSVARSIDYAVAMGVDVISISLGSESTDTYTRQAVQRALAAGIVVVAAAGNDGCDCMIYPAAYPEVLSVGALNSSGQPASFSSFGANLDILAPGVNMTTTSWQAGNQTAAYVSGINGTSFAAPLVAGMLTRIKSWQPTATPAQLTAAVTESVNRLSLASSVMSDPQYGFGTLDAHKAAGRMTTSRTAQFSYVFSPISRGGTLQSSAPYEPAGNTLVYACETSDWPGTQVYELIRGDVQFYTISKVERQMAIQNGYTASLLLHGCLRQPHDTGITMRSLNIYKEFRNMDYKGIMGL